MMRLSTFLKLIAVLILAILVMKYGPWLAYSLMAQSNPSTGIRALSVAIAVGSFLPWLVVAGWAISRADEYARHVFLIGIALSVVGSMLFFTGYDFMRDTHLLAETSPIPWFPVMIGCWALGTAVASAYYRLRR